MSRRENFTAYETMPEDLAIYMSHNGPHFNKRCFEFAVSKMYKVENGEEKEIAKRNKEEIDALLAKYNVKLKYNQLYDAAYVGNMCIADYYGSSISSEQNMARYIKDVIDDPDAIEGLVFNRWIADMKWLGIAIPWDELI